MTAVFSTRFLLTFALISLVLVGASAGVTRPSTLRPAKLVEMDAAVEDAVASGKIPGGVLWFEHAGAVHHKAFGKRALVPKAEPMTRDTIFDAASLTKVVACTPAILLLVERGKLKLDDQVRTHIPAFTGGGKETVTLRHLLTHTSGLRPDIGLTPDWTGTDAALQLACAEKLIHQPGENIVYSDTGPILLADIVRTVSGLPFDQFVRKEIFIPLGMNDTGFNPPREKSARIAPTEVENGTALRGIVHDPRARRMEGIAGHAGLFLSASDLARYARMLLNEGELDGVRIFKPETVRLMTGVQTPQSLSGRRGLGWDIESGRGGPRGSLFPVGSYGHTGWTGTSIWIDPFSQSFIIFLSNRNHPGESGSVSLLRHRLGTLAAEAVADFNFAAVPGALSPRFGGPRIRPTLRTLNGIDVLVKNKFAPLRGKRIGLVTNHTGMDRSRNPTIDLLKQAPGVRLVALFSPEHGIRGAQDEKIGDSTDSQTGLPVFSLYGERRKPSAEQLKGLDSLVFDIQDIGCRFYTYISTMGLCMEAAAEAGIPFIVLDRVNPINGTTIEGPVLTEKTTFVGFHPIPLRHAMTIGELARMFNAERKPKAELQVIELENWRRDAWLDETGLPWTNPSPNMRNLKQAILYPGIGLLEDALSVGRGTDTPFEVIGAPYIDDVKLAAALNQAGLPGVSFVPVRFTPLASTHKDQPCGGVYLMLNDREACNPVLIGLEIARTLHRLHPGKFDPGKIKHLLLHASTLAAIKADQSLEKIQNSWQADRLKFEQRREKYLIYR